MSDGPPTRRFNTFNAVDLPLFEEPRRRTLCEVDTTGVLFRGLVASEGYGDVSPPHKPHRAIEESHWLLLFACLTLTRLVARLRCLVGNMDDTKLGAVRGRLNPSLRLHARPALILWVGCLWSDLYSVGFQTLLASSLLIIENALSVALSSEIILASPGEGFTVVPLRA